MINDIEGTTFESRMASATIKGFFVSFWILEKLSIVSMGTNLRAEQESVCCEQREFVDLHLRVHLRDKICIVCEVIARKIKFHLRFYGVFDIGLV